MPALAGKKALIKIPSAAVAFTNEPATAAGDGQNYQITDATKRVWDATIAIVVKVGGSVTGESYTINRLTGTVTFVTTNVGRAAVTISGSYLPMSTVLEAKSYSYQLVGRNVPDNSFGDDWVTRVQVQKDVRGSIGRWFFDAFFSGALIADTLLVFQFYSNSSAASDLTFWGRLSRRSIQLIHASLSEETLDFEGALDVDNRAIDLVSVAPDEVAYLRSNLSGGDSGMLALYLGSRGITTVSTAVSQWDDARGPSSFGPSLTQATAGKRPAWDSVNQVMTFDGVDDELASSLVSMFNVDVAKTLVIVATLNTAGATVTPAALANASASALLGFRQDSGGGATVKGQMNNGGSPVIADSTVPIGSRRLYIVSLDGVNAVAIDVPNHARVTTTSGGMPANATGSLCIGDYQAAGGSYSPEIVSRVIVMSGQISAGDLTVLKTWATTYAGAVLA